MTLLSQREAKLARASFALNQEIIRLQKLEYAVCDENLRVVENSPHLNQYVRDNSGALIGARLDELFDLLTGMDDDLERVIRNELPEIAIEKIAHRFQDGESGYFTLRVIHHQRGLLALVQNVTTEGLLEQRVTQQRNDLNLLGAQLARSRADLDYLLRRFVPSQVADRIISQPSQVKLGGDKRVVTALFADMRGFTKLSEVVSPEVMLDMLNQHFDLLGQIITRHGGVITNYAGDMVMAIFNAPEEQPDHAMQAVQAGLEIQSTLQGLNEKPRIDMPFVFDFGVGINTGGGVVGYLGYESRLEYPAIGESINTASRFSGIARAGQVLLGTATHAAVSGRLKTQSLGNITLRGKNESVPVYEALADQQSKQ
jgi:adenylate cyclase